MHTMLEKSIKPWEQIKEKMFPKAIQLIV